MEQNKIQIHLSVPNNYLIPEPRCHRNVLKPSKTSLMCLRRVLVVSHR